MRIFFALLVTAAAVAFIALLGAKAINTGVIALKFMTLISIPAAGAIIMAIIGSAKKGRKGG